MIKKEILRVYLRLKIMCSSEEQNTFGLPVHGEWVSPAARAIYGSHCEPYLGSRVGSHCRSGTASISYSI